MSRRSIVIADENDLPQAVAVVAGLLRRGDVVTLSGDLGAGKTAFARCLINTLSPVPEEVPSPTFTLVQTYDLPDFSLWHFDLYRLKEEGRDILELGWDEARRDGVMLIEWAERLGGTHPHGLLPRDRLEITIKHLPDSENSREFTFIPHGRWVSRFESHE